MRRRLIMLVVILLAAAGGYWYYKMQANSPVVLTGIVTTDDVTVSSQVAGQLQELLVNQGDVVKRDQVLARIFPDEWAANMRYFGAAQQQATTQVSQAEADLRFEEQETNNQIVQAQANVAAADAQIKQGEADLENARLVFERDDEAFKRGAESAQEHDQARTAYDAQKAKVETFRKQDDAAQAAVNVAKASLEQIAMKKSALAAVKHQQEAAAAQSDKARVELGYTEIKAPIDGIVDQRAALQGEVVSISQPIVTLVDPDNLWVRVDVEEGFIDQIHLGEKMMVKLPSGAEREGVVIFRGVDADYATQRDVSRTKRDIKTFEVRLRCDNHDRALALGMSAYVTLPGTK